MIVYRIYSGVLYTWMSCNLKQKQGIVNRENIILVIPWSTKEKANYWSSYWIEANILVSGVGSGLVIKACPYMFGTSKLIIIISEIQYITEYFLNSIFCLFSCSSSIMARNLLALLKIVTIFPDILF